MEINIVSECGGRKLRKNKMLKTRCNKCGKEIDRKKEYFVVLLHKEKMIDNEIEVLNNEELEMFCCEGCLGGK